MRTCVALLFVSVMVVLATAEGNKNEKNVEEWTSRVGRGTPNRNKVNLKRDRKRIKPTRQRNGPGRRSKKINHKISKPGVRVEISNRGNLQRTKNFENVKATLKQKNPPFPACSYLDFGKITAEGKDCSKDGYKFVVKGPTGVRKQFLHVDDRLILAFVATGEKFATCTKFEDITGQVECKIVGGLAGTILNTKKDLKKADNFDACSYLDLGQITVQGTDCSNDGYKFVVKGKPKGVRKQFLHVDNKVIVAFVAPGDDNKFANCPAFQDITAQVTCTKVDGLAGTKLDNVVSGSGVALILGGETSGAIKTSKISKIGNCDPNVRPLPTPIEDHAAVTLDGTVYYCGGTTDSGVSNKCYKLEKDGSWSPAPSMIETRASLGLATVGSRLVAVGGLRKPNEFLSSIEVLNSGSANWEMQNFGLIQERLQPCVVAISKSELVAIGGYFFFVALNYVERINIDTGEVTALDRLPYFMTGMACQLLNNRIYIAGGLIDRTLLDNGQEITNAVHTLDFSNINNKWQTGPPLNNPRLDLSSAILNGQMVAIGGFDEEYNYLESYETLVGGVWVTGYTPAIRNTAVAVLPCI